VGLPDTNGAHLATRSDIELTGRATDPIGGRGGQAVGHGHHGLLGPGFDNLGGQLGHAVDAAARAVDVYQDLAHSVVRQDLAQYAREFLGAGAARPRDVIDHVAALRDHTVQGQDRDAQTSTGGRTI
jgi:hypothetical protein